jgi:hypothetical protein
MAERRRLRSQGAENDKIVAGQTKMYRRQLTALDSVNLLIIISKSDTTFMDYQIVKDGGSPFGNFVPKLMESGQCLIFDTSMNRQSLLSGKTNLGLLTSSRKTAHL